MTCALHHPPKPQHEFATGEEKTKTSKALLFFLKNTLKGKFVCIFYLHFIFLYILLGGQPFLMMTGDQASLQSVLCPTSDLTCGVTMFIIISKEKKNLVKKTKQQKNNPGLAGTMCASRDDWRCARSMHEFSAKDIDGHMICLDKYRGFVCIVTNVASQ